MTIREYEMKGNPGIFHGWLSIFAVLNRQAPEAKPDSDGASLFLICPFSPEPLRRTFSFAYNESARGVKSLP